MVQINKFWIEGVLAEAFPRFKHSFKKSEGVDLNKDGRITDAEIFGDLNQNGTVGDREDYQQYLAKNRSTLSSAVPFFKWGERLSVKNRIHQLMYLESDLHPAAWVESAYILIADMAKDVGRAKKAAKPNGRALTNIKEAEFYYWAIKDSGIAIGESDDQSFVDDESFIGNIHSRVLDCDTSSYLAMALGDESGLELNPVQAPEHLFLRGRDENGQEFNIDHGELTVDEDYIDADPDAVRHGVYLRTLDGPGTEAQFLNGRGNVLEKLGRYEEALAAYDRTMALDPKMADAHYNRGVALGELGRYEEALAAYDRAIALDPKMADAHYNRGVVLEKLGRHEAALAAYDRAIALDPKMANAHYNRGVVLEELGRFPEALFAYGMAAIWGSK